LGEDTLREVFGAHAQHRVSLLQRPDDLVLVAQDIPAQLEYTSQSKYKWLFGHNHSLSSRWDGGITPR